MSKPDRRPFPSEYDPETKRLTVSIPLPARSVCEFVAEARAAGMSADCLRETFADLDPEVVERLFTIGHDLEWTGEWETNEGSALVGLCSFCEGWMGVFTSGAEIDVFWDPKLDGAVDLMLEKIEALRAGRGGR